MGFAWVTNVGVGADIDAADRVETKTNIASLYTDLGKNWPGNVRFPACGGAGYDMAAPCAVVWDIAPGEDIYQTPGAHPVSELQEARDKLDWIDDNKCGTENVGHDSPENAAANPTTLGAANPITRGAANPITHVTYQPGCGSDCPSEDAAANDYTQSAENPITNLIYQPGCSDCPLEDGAANPATQYEDDLGCTAACPAANTGANPSANDPYNADLATYKAIYEGDHYSGDDANDRGTVRSTNFYENWPILFYGVLTIYNTPYCSSEKSGVFTHVYYGHG